MKHCLCLAANLLIAFTACNSEQIPQVHPYAVHDIHKCGLEGYRALWEHWRTHSMSEQEKALENELERNDDEIFYDFYSIADSWYVAGKVDTVYTTNTRLQINDCAVADGMPETAWIDDSPKGTLPTITLWLSGACPRITQVSIFNGNVNTKDSWEEYGRAKRMRLVYEGNPVAILELEDSRTFQQFKVDTLGHHDNNHEVWSLSFEIVEVFPGTRTDKVAISEIMFDGVDYL